MDGCIRSTTYEPANHAALPPSLSPRHDELPVDRLTWSLIGSLELARTDLAARYLIATAVAGTLTRAGVRDDRAAAEALLVVEVGSWRREWHSIVATMVETGAPP